MLVYSRTNNEFCLSLQQYPVGDSHNTNNNGMRAPDGSEDTLGLQEKAPSRGMRYLVNITNKFHVATRNTSSPTRTHTLWNKDAQRKRRHHTHPWIYGSHVGAWLGPFSVLQHTTADGCGGRSPGNRRRSSEHDHMHAWHVRWKNLHRRRKGHAHPHPSLSWYTRRITTNQASVRSKPDDVVVQRTACWRVCVRKCHVVGEFFI